ncbi:hypothetical protein VQ02_09675 [Methylobacterium variabile]|jgi:hypothetical protein|uniref:Uncharacterized protein n=1 Tax=Methylobacterium variabile TaxID=298794 RepID=A0A0J6T0Y7_9HYPH|nr:hypothetical protein [Methylobacterium variabile]KMO39649.1 hypothetical protein VQ02_09675 [Methylobacterium variabile]
MAFWLRAGLVIGAIYYLSPLRLGEAPGPAHAPAASGPTQGGQMHAGHGIGEIVGTKAAAPILAALPDDLRARAVEAAAAEAGRALGPGLRAILAEAGRSGSRDTLTAQDRQPPWRGTPERDSR